MMKNLASNNKQSVKNSRVFRHGFILPFSVVLSVITLSLGFTIFAIAYKEFLLGSINRDSQFSFYASDTGSECALYWDLHPDGSIFPTSSDSAAVVSPKNCVGQDITLTGSPSFWTETRSSNAATTSFVVNLGSNVCANVVIAKNSPTTTVESKGYNRCSASDNRRVERAVRYRY